MREEEMELAMGGNGEKRIDLEEERGIDLMEESGLSDRPCLLCIDTGWI